MLKKTAIAYFKRPIVVAETLGIDRQRFHQWGKVLPYWAACMLQTKTNGAIKVDERLYKIEKVPV